MARPRRTFSDEMRASARDLYDEGFGCNAIAAKLDISPSVISRWARDEDLSFDRSQAALAVRAHTIDLAESRVDLARKMQQAAHDMLDMMDKPFEVYNFGGRDNTFESATLDSMPIEARRVVMTAAGIAFDKASRIVERDNGGLDEAVGILDRIADGFKAAAERYRAETTPAVDDAAE